MELGSRIPSTRMSLRTFPQPLTTRCKSDPQPYACHREPTKSSVFSRWDTTTELTPFSNVRNRSRHDLLRTLAEATAERKRNQEMLELTKELEKLSSENIQLKEETFESDYNYVTMIDQLASKESEIENLRNELSQLSKQITLSTAKEEEYINNARSCLHLEEQIEALQKRLSVQKMDFEQLASAHADCPSPERVDSALKEVKSTYRTCLEAANDKLSERDRQIAELEDSIARKDQELKEMAGELTKHRTDRSVEDMQRQELNLRLAEVNSVVQDRERLISKMRVLMTRKSVKVNLLLQRIKELEMKLEDCQKRLREHHSPTHSASIKNDQLGFQYLSNTCSLENVTKPVIKYGKTPSCHGAGDNIEEEDSQGLLDETTKLQSDLANTFIVPSNYDLLFKINNIRNKIRHKLVKEIGKRSKISETIGDSRRRFDRTQLEIEEIRKHRQDAEGSREQIMSRVLHEQQLSKLIESSENESRVITAKIISFERALRNLENLEMFIFPAENKHK